MMMKVIAWKTSLNINFFIWIEEGEAEEPINPNSDNDFNLEDYLRFRATLND